MNDLQVVKWPVEKLCNAIGTGIKPQSLHPNEETKQKIQKLWAQWVDEADAAGITNLYGLEALAFRSMVEGGSASSGSINARCVTGSRFIGTHRYR